MRGLQGKLVFRGEEEGSGVDLMWALYRSLRDSYRREYGMLRMENQALQESNDGLTMTIVRLRSPDAELQRENSLLRDAVSQAITVMQR